MDKIASQRRQFFLPSRMPVDLVGRVISQPQLIGSIVLNTVSIDINSLSLQSRIVPPYRSATEWGHYQVYTLAMCMPVVFAATASP